MSDQIDYILHLGDNALVLGHRNSEWTGHGPILEQDIALSNIALDLIGQARYYYQYASGRINADGHALRAVPGREAVTEDVLAYLRDAWDFRNCLLVEQGNGHWGKTILRQFFFSAYQFELYGVLRHSRDNQLAAIAAKSLKEVTYHLRWSGEWVIRLGDGTEESHTRMEEALEDLWRYTGELFAPADYEKTLALSGVAVDLATIRPSWEVKVDEVLKSAGLEKKKANGCKKGESKENTPKRWDTCWRKCSSCSVPIPDANGDHMANTVTDTTIQELWTLLGEVNDPEVPVLSVIDLGIIRDIRIIYDTPGTTNGVPEIVITPTYSGCPAMDMIRMGIRMLLLEKGYPDVRIETVLWPAWTTDWMSEAGKQKLEAYGIAPPMPTQTVCRLEMFSREEAIQCPHCHSYHTTMISEFGSTACKALYRCEDCKEPFDYFKCH